jgi:uncharacterized protein (DUF433 family)
MAAAPRVTTDPRVLCGKPVIRGTRVSVDLLLRDLAEGASTAPLFEAYPSISEADVRAALAYAGDAVRAATDRETRG